MKKLQLSSMYGQKGRKKMNIEEVSYELGVLKAKAIIASDKNDNTLDESVVILMNNIEINDDRFEIGFKEELKIHNITDNEACNLFIDVQNGVI